MPPGTSAPPAQPTPPSHDAASPSTSLKDFDATFGFDDDQSPTPEPSPEPTPETSPEPTSSPDPSKPAEKPKDPETGRFKKQDAKPEPKKDTKAPEVHDEFTPPQVATGSQLRKFAETAGTRARQALSKVANLEAEIQKLKSTPQGDVQAVAQQLAQANQKLQQYENEARLTRYERSEEYRTKYEQPYQNLVKQAYSDVKELLVSIPKPTEEDPNATQEREATAADFDEIYGLPLGPASKLARQKFGDQAGIVLQHRQAIKNAAKEAVDAVEANKNNASKYEQEQIAAQKMRQEANNQMFSTVIEDLQTKYPARFGEREGTLDGSKEWNEERNRGLSMADMAFDGEARSKLPPEKSAILDGQIHLRAAHYGAEHKLRVFFEEKAKQLTQELAQIRGSSPGRPGPSTNAPTNGKRKGAMEGFDDKFGSDET